MWLNFATFAKKMIIIRPRELISLILSAFSVRILVHSLESILSSNVCPLFLLFARCVCNAYATKKA